MNQLSQEHRDAMQIIQALQKQTELLERTAKASERTNELLFAILTPEQKKAVHDAGVSKLAQPRKP